MDPEQLKGLLAQAQQMATEMQNDLGHKTAQGAAGGGLVTVTVNGNNQVLAVKIDPKAIDPSDPTMLEDLVRAAVNQATDKLKELVAEELRQRAGGVGIPGLF